MPRLPKIWLRLQDGYYYTTLHGKQIKLSPQIEEATQQFHALVAQSKRLKNTEANTLTFRELADQFLQKHCERHHTPKAMRVYIRCLRDFAKPIGQRKAHQILPPDVEAWLGKHHPDNPRPSKKRLWEQSYRQTRRAILLACFNWGLRNGYLLHNPIAAITREPVEARIRILSKAEREAIRVACSVPMGRFLRFLELTGARPNPSPPCRARLVSQTRV